MTHSLTPEEKNLIKKWAEDPNRYLPKEDVEIPLLATFSWDLGVFLPLDLNGNSGSASWPACLYGGTGVNTHTHRFFGSYFSGYP